MMTRITVGLWSDTAAGMIERESESFGGSRPETKQMGKMFWRDWKV